jgi:hypothetical protein
MGDNEIKEVLKKQEETLVLVHKLWRAEKWRRVWKVVKCVVFLGIIVGAFYFITPYVERYIGLIQQFQGIKGPQDLQGILEQLK